MTPLRDLPGSGCLPLPPLHLFRQQLQEHIVAPHIQPGLLELRLPPGLRLEGVAPLSGLILPGRRFAPGPEGELHRPLKMGVSHGCIPSLNFWTA